MATALKDLLGPEVPRRISAMVRAALPSFDTGTHHPGAHRIEVLVNGTVRASAEFEVAAAAAR